MNHLQDWIMTVLLSSQVTLSRMNIGIDLVPSLFEVGNQFQG